MICKTLMRHRNSPLGAHVFAFAKFGTVGLITTAIYFFVMWIANAKLALNYILAVSVAYLFSTLFHFLANRHFTFNALDDKHSSQLVRYLVMWALNYLITIVVVRICVERMALSPYLGVCVSVIFTVITGYFISRYWVFRMESGK
jgi:putative flippase GtrA